MNTEVAATFAAYPPKLKRRLILLRRKEGSCAMYFHCQTTLGDTFREMYRGQLRFEGNRSIVFDEGDETPVEVLSHCISLALTCHLRKPRVQDHRHRV